MNIYLCICPLTQCLLTNHSSVFRKSADFIVGYRTCSILDDKIVRQEKSVEFACHTTDISLSADIIGWQNSPILLLI